jgi:hypothetical protein
MPYPIEGGMERAMDKSMSHMVFGAKGAEKKQKNMQKVMCRLFLSSQ